MPSGTANSEVGWSSSGASGSIPGGAVKALCASSDFGFRSSNPDPSASATRPPVLGSLVSVCGIVYSPAKAERDGE